ncbi:MAG: monovalent cation/H+ antiporter subunit A [Pseudomonadota bacterium]|nr:monovalent cation/H+ antiporter subunit A [Pseudomonadota bacterium]
MNLLVAVIAPFLGALLPAFSARFGRTRCAWVSAIPVLVAAASLGAWAPSVLEGETRRVVVPWLTDVGFELAFRLDGLALLFAVLVLGIGALVILYARYYLSEQDPMARFFTLLLLFMGSMLGVVTADNLLLLVVFWELTSLSSFLLIGYWSFREDARQGARMALMVTGAGGLALLAGVLLLGQVVGSYDLGAVLASGDLVRADSRYPLILLLVLAGVFTKSAQFPFHVWLPQAMSAPTPVSAYLHSATMVKAGVFLLARLYPALSGTDLWFVVVTGFGLVTVLFGAVVALFQHDLKGLLAYSTISHLGLITMLFGLDTQVATVGAIFHVINHAIFKASLFMAAGIIDHETGSRDMRRINGLWRYMPITGALAMVASASMAGVPLLNGFLSKEMFFSEALHLQELARGQWILPVGALVAGIFAVAYSLRFIHDVFFNGEPIDLPHFPPHEPPRYMRFPVEVLILLCLLLGTLPQWTVTPLLFSAVEAALQTSPPEYSVKIWHGLNTPLAMSVAALVGGAMLYAVRRPLMEVYDRTAQTDTRALFMAVVERAVALAGRARQSLSGAPLQWQLILLLALAAVSALLVDWTAGAGAGVVAPSLAVDWVAVTVVGLTVVSAVGVALFHRRRLFALILLSAVGVGVSLLFAAFSAPDLVLTQLAVEVVSIVLLLLVLYLLPRSTPSERRPGMHLLRMGLAVTLGVAAAVLVHGMLVNPVESIAQYYVDNAVPGGGGHNVVNVILVDFRGFDTLGEITVLAVAAVGIGTLLHKFAPVLPTEDQFPRAADAHPALLRLQARVLLPLALAFSAYVMLRGHQLPGGGFVAGLITGGALVLQYMANGAEWSQRRLGGAHHRLVAAGVALATLTGVASWGFGHPFLTSTHGHWVVPVLGHVELASAMAFDLGVYTTVVGVTLQILTTLGEVTVPGSLSRHHDGWVQEGGA